MSIYASRRNPSYEAGCIGICITGADIGVGPSWQVAYPHPECEPHSLAIQHNEPNPVLEIFRYDARRYTSATHAAQAWLNFWEMVRVFGPGVQDATDSEQMHARRVLERLARFRRQP